MSKAAPQGEEGPLIPILVDGMGRDGTTITMQLLGTSWEIAFDRIYPYEQRYLSYLLALAQVPEREEWDEVTWNGDHLAVPSTWILDQGLVGPLPWKQRKLLFGGGDPSDPAWPAFFDVVWREFSRRARASIRAECGDRNQPVTHYAQKITAAWTLDPRVLRKSKLVLLLRDPRDTWLSMLAFDQARRARGLPGFIQFAGDKVTSDFLPRFLASQKARLRWISTQTWDSHVLRYEQLVVDMSTVARQLSGWLGIELDHAEVPQETSWTKEHATSETPADSIGRWRHEMSDDIAAEFARELAPELEAHGYDT
jgi:hypothetical protein